MIEFQSGSIDMPEMLLRWIEELISFRCQNRQMLNISPGQLSAARHASTASSTIVVLLLCFEYESEHARCFGRSCRRAGVFQSALTVQIRRSNA